MAYSTSNPPVLAFQAMAFGRSAIGSTTYGAGSSAVGGNFWLYMSTHLQTDVGSSDFIADGSLSGIRVRDSLMAISLSSGITFHRCTAVGSTFSSWSVGLLVSSAS